MKRPLLLALFFAFIILLRNAWLYWGYSYAFYPDSDLYVHTGASFFASWYIPPVVTFPYPLLNAVTHSYTGPSLLVWVQIILGAAAGGILIYIIARKNLLLAAIAGVLLSMDLVWGANSRALLTDGLFADMNLLSLALIAWHYERRFKISPWEAGLAGLFFALAFCIRPSNIFLAALIPPFYGWLTRSWKSVLLVMVGIGIFLASMGLINLKGTGKFYILSSEGGYTNEMLAFPLFVYRLYAPENGPASRSLDQYLQACYPGLDYAQAVDRSEGNAFDSVKNMAFITKQVLPCVTEEKAVHGDERNLFPAAYLEALTAHPVQFILTMSRETAVFLKYGNAYVLRWQLNPASNYGCTNIPWCNQINAGRYQWSSSSPWVNLYEKAATKVLQVYLAPMGVLTAVFPEKETLPVLFSWAAITLFLILFARGHERLIAIASAGLVLYTAVVVVAALGFTERYASMLSPIQAIYSALAWYSLGRLLVWLWKNAISTYAERLGRKRAIG